MSLSTSPFNGTTPTDHDPQPAAAALPDIPGLGGAIAGLAGGVMMIAAAALIAASMGLEVWQEPRQIAALVYGLGARAGTIDGAVIVGLLIHLLVSALLGAIFGIVSRRLLHLTSDFGTPVLVGMIYGMLIWLAAYFVVLPIVTPALLNMYQPSFMIQHLVYGTVTGLVYTKLRPEPYVGGRSGAGAG